jgi:hypothetical protein
MAADLDDLVAKVEANPDVEASVELLVTGVAAKIDAVKSDPAALSTLSSKLTSSAPSFAKAAAANTPAGASQSPRETPKEFTREPPPKEFQEPQRVKSSKEHG